MKESREDRKPKSSPGEFPELHLTAGLLAVAVSALLFVLIAADVVNGGAVTLIDTRLSFWLHTYRTPSVTSFFRLISKIHSGLIVSIVTVVICAYLWTKHLREWVLTLLLAVFGGMLLNLALKHLFERLRPSFADAMPRLTTFSFPSGHTLLASVFYGSLCAFLFSRTQSWTLRAVGTILAFSMVVLVGFSRLYLGAHYLTDVLGAMAEGLGWLAAIFLIVALIGRQRTAVIQ